jgi:hypothetical protein
MVLDYQQLYLVQILNRLWSLQALPDEMEQKVGELLHSDLPSFQRHGLVLFHKTSLQQCAIRINADKQKDIFMLHKEQMRCNSITIERPIWSKRGFTFHCMATRYPINACLRFQQGGDIETISFQRIAKKMLQRSNIGQRQHFSDIFFSVRGWFQRRLGRELLPQGVFQQHFRTKSQFRENDTGTFQHNIVQNAHRHIGSFTEHEIRKIPALCAAQDHQLHSCQIGRMRR